MGRDLEYGECPTKSRPKDSLSQASHNVDHHLICEFRVALNEPLEAQLDRV